MTSYPPPYGYTPLCVIAVPRSGSTLLKNILNNHPDVVMHGESLSTSKRSRDQAPHWQDRPHIAYESGPYLSYLKEHVFPPDGGKAKIIGFKLFPHHLNAAPEGRDNAADAIFSIPNLKIIFLVRENLLDVALSTEIAARNDQWTSFSNDSSTPPEPLDIRPEALFWRMEHIQREYALGEHLLRDTPHFRLTYNDLTLRTEAVVGELQTWLGASPRQLQPNGRLRKQRTCPRQSALSDFAEIRTRCAAEHPEWVKFFDEPETLREVPHHGSNGRFSIVLRKPPGSLRPDARERGPAFYLQLFHDGDMAAHALQRLRRCYWHERILLQSDGDDDPFYPQLAERHNCEYNAGQRLYTLENGGKMLQRMLNMYLAGEGACLIKIDTDTRMDRRFRSLPQDRGVYGTLLRQGPPQGGCVIIPRDTARELRDSRILLSPALTDPSTSWGEPMHRNFLKERLAVGCIGFEWTLYWACTQLGIPVLPHPEVHATWKQGHVNREYRYAAVHPDKFLDVEDRPVHDLCTTSHSGLHTIWLEAIHHSA